MIRGAESLAICRIVVYACALYYYGAADYSQWRSVPHVFWKPIFLFQALHVGPQSVAAVVVVQWVWRASLVLSCVGLFARVAMPVAGLAGLYLLALPNNYGRIMHGSAALAVALLILG